jgi:hypothetical protein
MLIFSGITAPVMSMNPVILISKATKAVPAVKYAVGILGLVAVIAVIIQLKVDLGVAVIGTIVLLGLMVMLLVFARLSLMPGNAFRQPALVLMWAMVILFIALCLLLIWSTFFNGPKIQSPFAKDAQLLKIQPDTSQRHTAAASPRSTADTGVSGSSTEKTQQAKAPRPLMEFTLSALQPHVINQWRATLELSGAITKDQLIKLRIGKRAGSTNPPYRTFSADHHYRCGRLFLFSDRAGHLGARIALRYPKNIQALTIFNLSVPFPP